MTAHDTPFRSDLFYSVQNEDYQAELAVLHRLGRTDLRVLMIASAGENALSLLTQESVTVIHAVDINPAQLALCELRRAAALRYTRAEQLRLLGADRTFPPDGGAEARFALYEALRPHLPDATRQFWDARRDREIAYSVQHVGRNDAIMHLIHARLRDAGLDPLERIPAESDLPVFRAVFEAVFAPANVQSVMGFPTPVLAERIASIAGYVGQCTFHALRQPDAARNPLLTTCFGGAYAGGAGEAGYPLYMQTAGLDALRQPDAADRLRLYQGNVLEWLPRIAAASGPLDLISISNIADWMTDAEFGAVVDQARACLRVGGALLARTATPRAMIQEVMAAHMPTDGAFNAELAAHERGPWFRILAAGFKA